MSSRLDRSCVHSVLPIPSEDEQAAQQQIIAMKRTLQGVKGELKRHYAEVLEPKYLAEHEGQGPATPEEVFEILQESPLFRVFSTLGVQAQELMWTLVQSTVNRELPRISAEASRLMRERPAGGSVTIPDPSNFLEPEDVLVVPIHKQPGGYMEDLGPEDIKAGALYEMGGRIYSFSLGTKPNDSKGHFVVRELQKTHPGFSPSRILDIGCSAGAATVVYKDCFPEAQVVGIDVGPSIVRYAHARAESLGVQVDFHQMNGVQMTFPDNHFDFIVSNNLMHEVTTKNFEGILKECFRVLAPGGVLLFQEIPISWAASKPSLVDQALMIIQMMDNNEPHFVDCCKRDIVGCTRAAGFQSVSERIVDSSTAPRGRWYLLEATKEKAK